MTHRENEPRDDEQPRQVPHESTDERREDAAEERESNAEGEAAAQAVTQQEIAGIRESLKPKLSELSVEDRAAKIVAYEQEHIPDHLQGDTRPPHLLPWLSRLKLKAQEMLGKLRIEGRENIPTQGPFLVVSNHSGGETPFIFGLFGHLPLRVAAAKEVHVNRSGALSRWVFRNIFKAIPCKESLAHLTDEQKHALVEKAPAHQRSAFQRVIEQEHVNRAEEDTAFIRSAVACLARGDVVAMFPEGLFTFEGRSLREAYPGGELIARQYKKLTGQDLTIVPVGITPTNATIGKPIALSQNDTELSGTEWTMGHIASLLPERDRGHYTNAANTIRSPTGETKE